MPYQRQRDPVPWSRGGEVALVVIAGVLLAVALAALLGLGVASAWFGGGWVWPHGSDTIGRALGGLVSGQPGRGLPDADARRVADAGAVYACVATCEVLLIAAAIAVTVLALRWIRPGDARRGMASRAEAQRVLGQSRLRESARLIRPDLHHRSKSTTGGAG